MVGSAGVQVDDLSLNDLKCLMCGAPLLEFTVPEVVYDEVWRWGLSVGIVLQAFSGWHPKSGNAYVRFALSLKPLSAGVTVEDYGRMVREYVARIGEWAFWHPLTPLTLVHCPLTMMWSKIKDVEMFIPEYLVIPRVREDVARIIRWFAVAAMRCEDCGAFLLPVREREGSIDAVCPRCGASPKVPWRYAEWRVENLDELVPYLSMVLSVASIRKILGEPTLPGVGPDSIIKYLKEECGRLGDPTCLPMLLVELCRPLRIARRFFLQRDYFRSRWGSGEQEFRTVLGVYAAMINVYSEILEEYSEVLGKTPEQGWVW